MLQALARRQTVLLERATEMVGYGLAICAIACLMPGRVVSHVNVMAAPDLWLGLGFDRGIEVACRDSGRASYDAAIRDKVAAIASRADLIEAYVSVWGIDLTAGHKERVR